MSANGKHKAPIRTGRGGIASGKVNPYLSLAQAIVYQAVLDWKAMSEGKVISKETKHSLLKFFNSPWCEQLLIYTDIEPKDIIRELQKGDRLGY